jgi:hypothetical protein
MRGANEVMLGFQFGGSNSKDNEEIKKSLKVKLFLEKILFLTLLRLQMR